MQERRIFWRQYDFGILAYHIYSILVWKQSLFWIFFTIIQNLLSYTMLSPVIKIKH